MCGGRWLVLCLAFALWLGVPALATARDDGAAVWGANHFCFQAAHEQPTGQPPDAVRFGWVINIYLEDCRGETVLPTDDWP